MIVFVSNFFNHHQQPLADELFQLTNGDYKFIETSPMPEIFVKGGYSNKLARPYLIRAWQSGELRLEANEIILNADVVLFGANIDYNLVKRRLQNDKITFEVGERWLKRGIVNLLSPRLLKSQLFYHLYFYNKPLFHLNASAYAANDFALMHSFKNKMFKWGYFTKVPQLDIKKILETFRDVSKIKILYISRFLFWKHPEMPVYLADKLKKEGVDFELNMYGSGTELEKTKRLVEKLGLEGHVKFPGNRPNNEILEIVRQHDIFLFTSDRNEGWGAVLNEAMSNGCTVVASNAIGSVPFLIKHKENGLIFKSCDVEDLYDKVKYLIDHPTKRKNMALNAYKTMRDIWSPKNAASNLIKLIHGIHNGCLTIIENGPCSPASPIQ